VKNQFFLGGGVIISNVLFAPWSALFTPHDFLLSRLKGSVLESGPRAVVDLKGNIANETAAIAPAMLAAAFTNMECHIGLCPGERKPVSAFSVTKLVTHVPRYALAKFCFNGQIAA
jgi:hypothetical protein